MIRETVIKVTDVYKFNFKDNYSSTHIYEGALSDRIFNTLNARVVLRLKLPFLDSLISSDYVFYFEETY